MKFSLLNLLLVLVTLGLACGWAVERRLDRENIKAIAKRENLEGRIRQAVDTYDRYFVDSDSFNEYAETEAVETIRLLWQNESEIDQATYSQMLDESAEFRAYALLKRMGCTSPDSFRQLAKSLYRFQTTALQEKNNRVVIDSGRAFPALNQDGYPEFYNTSSDEYYSLSDFLSRALIRNKR